MFRLLDYSFRNEIKNSHKIFAKKLYLQSFNLERTMILLGMK